MKTIQINTFSFNELSEEAQQVAINNFLTNYEIDPFQVVDDCYLFDPKDIDLRDTLKENYNRDILIKNNRKNIYFNIDRNWYLDCTDAMEIQNDVLFLKYLGIPEYLQEQIQYEIFTLNNNSSTEIDFELVASEYEFTKAEGEILQSAKDKFSDLINEILGRIKFQYEYEASEEFAREMIETEECIYDVNGNLI